MITASINFLSTNITKDLTCRESELRATLNTNGVMMIPSMINLNNTLTLQVMLTPTDEMGRMIYGLIDRDKDTLGSVQRLCRNVYCLNSKHQAEFKRKLESGQITSVDDGIAEAKAMRNDRKKEMVR